MALNVSLCPGGCRSACNSAAPTGRISVKFVIGDFYENMSKISRFGQTRTKILGTLREDLSTFLLLLKICCKSFHVQHSMFYIAD